MIGPPPDPDRDLERPAVIGAVTRGPPNCPGRTRAQFPRAPVLPAFLGLWQVSTVNSARTLSLSPSFSYFLFLKGRGNCKNCHLGQKRSHCQSLTYGRLARADLSTPATAAMPDPLAPAELPQADEPAPVPRRATDENNPQSHGLPGSGCALCWRYRREPGSSGRRLGSWARAWRGFGSVGGALHGE
jgi:hypothetical protein